MYLSGGHTGTFLVTVLASVNWVLTFCPEQMGRRHIFGGQISENPFKLRAGGAELLDIIIFSGAEGAAQKVNMKITFRA